MNNISNVTTEKLVTSDYIKPFRMRYTQNGTQKIWDCIQAHDSVSILLHQIERDSFVVVQQFRPAVYISKARRANNGVNPQSVDKDSLSGDVGITFELCAGIVDKENASLVEIAQQEILEECGYDVPVDKIETITTFRSGVGIYGTEQTIFYAQVTDSMRKTRGGGNVDEGEMIDVVEIPVKGSFQFALDPVKEKPVGMMFALLWFHSVKAKQQQKLS